MIDEVDVGVPTVGAPYDVAARSCMSNNTMDRRAIADRLHAFYAEVIKQLQTSSAFTGCQLQQLSSPFLLDVSSAYLSAPVKIMFFGQETRGWLGSLHQTLQRHDPVKALQARYAKQMAIPKWQSAFLKKYRLLEQHLGHGVRGAIVWNNLLKMDVDRGPGQSRNARGYSNELTRLSAELVRYEVELLKPDVMIFGCGPAYDHVIKHHFPHWRTDAVVESRVLWRFTVGNARCYRTWHPRTVRKAGQTSITQCYQYIINHVKQSFPQHYQGTTP